MKKLVKLLLCVLLVFATFPVFTACGKDKDKTTYKMEDYFTVDGHYGWTEEQNKEQFLKYTQNEEITGNHLPIVAKSKVKIKSVTANCTYKPSWFDGLKTFDNLPDTWTTTLYTSNITIEKTKVKSMRLTMTPATNPNLPEIMEAGDEINFLLHEDYGYHFGINVLEIDFEPVE